MPSPLHPLPPLLLLFVSILVVHALPLQPSRQIVSPQPLPAPMGDGGVPPPALDGPVGDGFRPDDDVTVPGPQPARDNPANPNGGSIGTGGNPNPSDPPRNPMDGVNDQPPNRRPRETPTATQPPQIPDEDARQEEDLAATSSTEAEQTPEETPDETPEETDDLSVTKTEDASDSSETLGIVFSSIALAIVVLAAGGTALGINPPTAPPPTAYTAQAGTGAAAEAAGLADSPAVAAPPIAPAAVG